jgi:hypothetical protein
MWKNVEDEFAIGSFMFQGSQIQSVECMICRVVVWGCSFQDSCVFGMALYVCLMHMSNCVIYLSHVNGYVLCLKFVYWELVGDMEVVSKWLIN